MAPGTHTSPGGHFPIFTGVCRALPEWRYCERRDTTRLALRLDLEAASRHRVLFRFLFALIALAVAEPCAETKNGDQQNTPHEVGREC